MTKHPHARLFSHYPLLQLAVAYAAGVLFGTNTHLRLSIVFILTCLCTLLLCVALWKKFYTVSGLALISAMFFAGSALTVIQQRPGARNSVKEILNQKLIDEATPITLTGIIEGTPEFARDRLYLVIRVERVTTRDADLAASGFVSLLATFKTVSNEADYRHLDLRYGLRVRVRTTLNRTDKYRNPGVSTLTEYLDRKNYDATGLIKNPSAILPVGEVSVFKPLAWLYQWRARLQHEIDQNFTPETAGLLDAALLGNRYNLSRSSAERFREAGTFHVLVISGLHISFIGGLVFLVLRRTTRNRLVQFICSSLVVWGYTLAVGAEASVVRSALMFSFVTFGTVVFRSASSLNALGGAVLVLLIRSPQDLFDVSLQLTFLSVLAIVTISWPVLRSVQAIGSWRPTRETPYPPNCSRFLKSISEALHWSEIEWRAELIRYPHRYRMFKTPSAGSLERWHLQYPLKYVLNAVVVSVSVQIVLLPFLIFYFHRFSLASLVLNIGVSLLLAVLGGVALVALLICQISTTLAEPLLRLANGIDWIMVHSVDPFARFGLASVRVPEYSGLKLSIYFIYFLPLVALITMLLRWYPLRLERTSHVASAKVLVFSQVMLVAVVLFHPWSARSADGRFHIDFLDVGQGDAALVTMPDGTTLLVDGGGQPGFVVVPKGDGRDTSESDDRGAPGIGEKVVSEYLWWRGLDRVDYVLATHADADHIDGLNDVVKNFGVRAALVGRKPVSDSEYQKFQQTLIGRGTPIEVVNAGDELHFGAVTVSVLWPMFTNDPSAHSRNNDSVVLRLQFGERSILLTGDIEKEVETQLSSSQNLRVDVVKVPHHGSRTSSTESFVVATSPNLAVISVGRTSMFGHPHKDVVERWKSHGVEVLTTGECGTIHASTDGKSWSVSKFVE